MAYVKGLVLLSRFEYFESKQGTNIFKEFLKKVSTGDENYTRQPVDGANYYPDTTLARIDQILLEEYFNNDVDEFRKMGEWSAENLIDKYFNLYSEEHKPIDFLEQFARLRKYLIGVGEMNIVNEGKNSLIVRIDYGQNVPRSVCLSEQGFITGGLRLCGAKNIKIIEETCASSSDFLECKFKITFN